MEDLQNAEVECNQRCEKALEECEAQGQDTEECQQRWDDCVTECDRYA